MAGANNAVFAELISPFLRRKLAELEDKFGKGSEQWRALALQYECQAQESDIDAGERLRHYQSELKPCSRGRQLRGMERLYRRTILLEPTTACAAHCRWCLRGQYEINTLSRDDIESAARYIEESEECREIEEVLITRGDPLMVPKLLKTAIDALRDLAPNVRAIRIGTRIPLQDPDRIDDRLLAILAPRWEGEIELGVNINHPIEFWPETVAALRRLRGNRLRLYNQHPLLRGVNDRLDVLVPLYGLLRKHGIEAHYLFHAVPMAGMSHHRTSLQRGAMLCAMLCSCGQLSGRTKPRYAVMTDIGSRSGCAGIRTGACRAAPLRTTTAICGSGTGMPTRGVILRRESGRLSIEVRRRAQRAPAAANGRIPTVANASTLRCR